MMKRLGPAVLLGALVGYVGGTIGGSGAAAQQAPAPGSRASVPHIPPVPSPPLYPDPPLGPVHWSAEDLRTVYEARLSGRGSPGFQGQNFRTHSIGSIFRERFPTPKPSNRAGVMSHLDDADQHEGVSDFYVIIGGEGQMMTDGVIENRVYGSQPRGAAGSGQRFTTIYPGEFNGQPIVNGRTHDMKPGDWLAVPPNVPHWPGANPGKGLQYIVLKVNVGYYPTNLMY